MRERNVTLEMQNCSKTSKMASPDDTTPLDQTKCSVSKGCAIVLILFVLLAVAIICIMVTNPSLLHHPQIVAFHRRSTNIKEISSVGPLRYRSKRAIHYAHKSHNRTSVAGLARHLPTSSDPVPYTILTEPLKYTYKSIKLPGDLIPLEYHLDFNLDLDKDEYNGVVKIQLDCENPTYQIIFHARNITPTNITVFSGNNELDHHKISYIPEFEMFVVELEDELEEDKIYDVMIQYKAKYSAKLGGLYKSVYTDFGMKK